MEMTIDTDKPVIVELHGTRFKLFPDTYEVPNRIKVLRSPRKEVKYESFNGGKVLFECGS